MKQNLIFLVLILLSCSEPTKKNIGEPAKETIISLEIPDKIMDNSKLHYNKKTSLWTLEEALFSGYAVSYFEDSTLMQKVGILNGKKQNESKDYFPDGHLKYLANYHQGKLHGEKKTWSVDSTHILIAHLNYHLGKVHGVQKKWYPTGELFKVHHINMGKEEGIQQAFRKNGVLFANYEAKEGRIYGLKKAALCFGIEDENIQRTD